MKIRIIILLACSGFAVGQYSFAPVRVGGNPLTWGNGISGDGLVVAGGLYINGQPWRGIRWSADGSQEIVTGGQGMCASRSGDTIGGYIGETGFVWTAQHGVQILPALNGANPTASLVTALNGDGRWAVGWSYVNSVAKPVAWNTQYNFVEELPTLPADATTFPKGISDDGSVIVGHSNSGGVYAGIRWVNRIPALLGVPAGTSDPFVYAVSATGRVTVGYVMQGDGGIATRWVGNRPVPLPSLGRYNYAVDVSADGWVVALQASQGTSARTLYVWDPVNGPRELRTLLAAHGHPEALDWQYEDLAGISDDGTRLVGRGLGPENDLVFLAGIPPFCYANCDGSTAAPVLNVLDFNCFLNRFAAGDEVYANCDQSDTPPVLNVLDFNCFVIQFTAGCP